MKYLGILIVSLVLFMACSKDEPVNLSAACENGNRWMINYKDTFQPVTIYDSFRFVQGGGYHTFSWKRSPIHGMTLSVYQLPDSGKTIQYQKAFVREFKCTYNAIEYSFDNKTDTVFKITNKGTHYVFRAKDIQLIATGQSNIDFRACDVQNWDMMP